MCRNKRPEAYEPKMVRLLFLGHGITCFLKKIFILFILREKGKAWGRDRENLKGAVC